MRFRDLNFHPDPLEIWRGVSHLVIEFNHPLFFRSNLFYGFCKCRALHHVFLFVCPGDISTILWVKKLKFGDKSKDVLWQKKYFFNFLINRLIYLLLNYYPIINYLFIFFLIWAISQAPFELGSWYFDMTVTKWFGYKGYFWFID